MFVTKLLHCLVGKCPCFCAVLNSRIVDCLFRQAQKLPLKMSWYLANAIQSVALNIC